MTTTDNEQFNAATALKELTDKQIERDLRKARYEFYSSIAGYFLLFTLIVLCAGDPDLLDAIIKRVGNY